ncbi:hypothetical protein DEU32_11421 [Curtobacterium sp. AG1037]|uniref:hypothetical protein n=1 Tax=Curtobacterium sp. AG1037 TaxID=2183990 RepID=UPI000E0B6A21|nr:hypothetical protein [Curtobacterium sp. AG1037]RDH95056.1 hypothetical protein DEU32_11421 [Curtobacterium sp. AG1037]
MSNDSTTERSPFNRWWFIAGGFLVVIAVVLGLILSGVIGAGNGGGGNNAGGNPGAPAASSSPDDGGNSTQPASDVCSLEDGSQSIPTSGPAADWKTDVYFQYPTSDRYGPTTNPNSSEWGCFAHSPTGALFATANLVRGLAGPDYKKVAEAAGVNNAARKQWVDAQSPAQHTQTAGNVGQISGFQFQSAQQDSAVVSLALSASDVTGSMKVALVWDSATNNWKADFATSDLEFSRVDTPSAFTQWTVTNG